MNKKIKKYLLFIGLVIFSITGYAAPAKLNDVHINAVNDDMRITLSLTGAVYSQTFVLSNPPRLVVDLKNTQLATSLKNFNLNTANIKNIRIGYPAPNVTRVVFDLKTPMQFKIMSKQNDHQLIINLHSIGSFKKITEQTTSSFQPTTLSTAKIPAPHPIVIVIDAGHGGHDPGAIGPHGIKEKNVTLAISKRLADLINQEPGMHAVLTRQGDYYVPLRGRLKLARKGKADLFIALHADSYFNNRAQGASVYALSQHGATSEAARWLAKRDNYSELGGVDLRELNDQSYLLRSVLIDLAQTATITDSLHLGSMMLSNLKKCDASALYSRRTSSFYGIKITGYPVDFS